MPSNGGAPSINGELCPMNETGTIRGQEDNGFGNLVRCSRTVRRSLGGQLLKGLAHSLCAFGARFMGRSLPLMEGALPFEVCGRHGGPTKNMNVSMTVNGSVQAITVEPRMTLLDALRDVLRLTGPKKACDRGECGACTVLIEGRRVLSCMTLA